jgi:hypothetical protein
MNHATAPDANGEVGLTPTTPSLQQPWLFHMNSMDNWKVLEMRELINQYATP